MKWIIDLIKENYKILLLVSILILLLIDISTRFWFWKGLHLEYDASNFNNIVTPIGTIITALLFFILTVRQLEMLRRQNQVIESQNIKPHFEKEFERVMELLKEELPVQLPYTVVNSINCTNRIYVLLQGITQHTEYLEDLKLHLNGTRENYSIYRSRSYADDLNFLIYYSLNGIETLSEVESLVKRINESKILEEDKEYFKRRIINEFIGDYIKFINYLEKDNRFVDIPDKTFENTNLLFRPFHKSNFRKHYDNFRAIGKSYVKN